MSLTIRPSVEADAPALAEVLNDIIAAGGTTAYETPFTPQALWQSSLGGAKVLCCHTVLEGDTPVGFQTLARHPDLPADWGSIASFTRRNPPVRGAGTALFEATKARARALGLIAIDATIRADNVPGLGYYGKMGFVDYNVIRAVPLSDGTLVDRIQRKYLL